jgi:hypothetical protein
MWTKPDLRGSIIRSRAIIIALPHARLHVSLHYLTKYAMPVAKTKSPGDESGGKITDFFSPPSKRGRRVKPKETRGSR